MCNFLYLSQTSHIVIQQPKGPGRLRGRDGPSTLINSYTCISASAKRVGLWSVRLALFQSEMQELRTKCT